MPVVRFRCSVYYKTQNTLFGLFFVGVIYSILLLMTFKNVFCHTFDLTRQICVSCRYLDYFGWRRGWIAGLLLLSQLSEVHFRLSTLQRYITGGTWAKVARGSKPLYLLLTTLFLACYVFVELLLWCACEGSWRTRKGRCLILCVLQLVIGLAMLNRMWHHIK